MVSGLTLKSVIHFGFIFAHDMINWFAFIIFCVGDQFSQHHLLKGLYFHIVYSCFLCHRLIDHISVGLFLDSLFSSIDLCAIPVAYCFDYCNFVAYFEIKEGV